MSLYQEIDRALEEVFADYIQTEVVVKKFVESQAPGDSLYGVSRSSEISFTDVEGVSAFVVRRITDVDIQVYGKVIQDATAKFICRSEELRAHGLWSSTQDRPTITIKDRIYQDLTTYRLIRVQPIGKIEKKSVAVIMFAVENEE